MAVGNRIYFFGKQWDETLFYFLLRTSNFAWMSSLEWNWPHQGAKLMTVICHKLQLTRVRRISNVSLKFFAANTKVCRWTWSWGNFIHFPPSQLISLKSILMLLSRLLLGFTSELFPLSFPTNILHAFLFTHQHPCYMASPSWRPILHNPNKSTSRSYLLCDSLNSSHASFFLG
jgi:hypothetical protein